MTRSLVGRTPELDSAVHLAPFSGVVGGHEFQQVWEVISSETDAMA